MRDIPSGIELRHLQAFVAVAEELNFTAAAKQLFIAQQALSTRIQQLEQRVGVQLLRRTTRSVELTHPGRVFLADAAAILATVDAAVSAVRSAAGSEIFLNVGFAAPISHCLIRKGIEQWSERYPAGLVRIVHGDPLDPTGGLRGRDVDVAFVFGPFDATGFELIPLFSETLGVAMAWDHPLTIQETLELDDVLGEPTFWFPTPDRAWREFWEAAEHRDGDPPIYLGEYRSVDALLSILGTEHGVRVATEQLVGKLGPPAGVVWRPVPGLGSVQHSIARRVEDFRPEVTAFVELVDEAFSSQVDRQPNNEARSAFG